MQWIIIMILIVISVKMIIVMQTWSFPLIVNHITTQYHGFGDVIMIIRGSLNEEPGDRGVIEPGYLQQMQ